MNKVVRSGCQLRLRLTEARDEHGWSQQEMADKLGTTCVNVSRWERGITRPSPYFRKRLCTLFAKTEQELDLTLENQPRLEGRELNTQDELPAAFVPSPSVHPRIAPDALYDPMLPLPPTIPLVGRDRDLAYLKQRLHGVGNGALTALHGLPGVGKTALAVTLAHDPEIHAHFRDGILWAGLGHTPNVQGHLGRWGTLFGMSQAEMSELTDPAAWAVALRRAIGLRMMLLVIDDVWTVDAALTLKIGGPNCVHLISTRFPSIATQLAADGAVTIQELNGDEGMVLLRMLAPQVVEREVQRARELVQAVGGLPLALNLVGNYLRTQSSSGVPGHVTTTLQRLCDAGERLRIGEQQGSTEDCSPLAASDSPVSLHAIIEVTDQKLSEQVRAAFYALSTFPSKPNNFTEEAALAIAACTTETLDQLIDAGLLEINSTDRYSLHQTIVDYASLHIPDSLAKLRLIAYFTSFAETHRKDYDILENESTNILAALDIAFGQTDPTSLIRIVSAFVPFLIARGLYHTAETHLQRAYQMAMVTLDQYGLAGILLHLGEITWKRGDYAQADTYLQKGLEYARKFNDRERMCAILANLGSISWKKGGYELADVYLQEGLKLAQEVSNLERMCELLQILGSVERMQGSYKQAEAYLQEGLQLARQIEEKELTCPILLNLGAISAEQGSYVQAEAYFQEGLYLARQLRHREWMSAFLNNLGDSASEQEHYKQAMSYFQEGLELARQIEHREWVSFLLHNLGITARKQKDYHLSEHYTRESLSLAHQNGIPQITCFILNEYGNLRLDQHQPDLAAQNFQELLTCAPPGGQDFIALAYYGLARVARANGKQKEARQRGEKSLMIFEQMGRREALEIRKWLQTFPEDADNGEG